jgi:mono/diheme cytochrome c family protein
MIRRRCAPILFVALLTVLLLASAARAQGGDPARGAALYAENCVVCHGPDGQGRVGAALAKPFASVQPEALVRQTIARGVPGSVMPAWGKGYGGPLTDNQIEDLVAFVLSLGGERAPRLPTPTPFPVTPIPTVAGLAGDPGRGARIYAENCVVCHGPDGQGRIGAALAKDFPAIQPNAYIREVISRGIRGSKMPAWLQANGGPLSAQDVEDVTAFVRTLAAKAPAAPAPVALVPVSGGPSIPAITLGVVLLTAAAFLVAVAASRLRASE